MLHDPLVPAEKIEAVHALMAAGELGIAFQPIVDVRHHRLHAYEALARCPPSRFSGPTELYATAVRAGRVGELGRMHREQASRICAGQALYLNIAPAELDQGWLVRPDDPFFRHRGQVTLELTETAPIHYFAQCHSILAEIRAKGVLLAIDDFGAGYSNLKYIADLEPEIVKLDRQLVTGLAPGSRQYRLVDSIVKLCHELGSKVLAEGIETPAELNAVEALGIDLAQGYLLARPSNPPPDFGWPHKLF
jgi:EAL domain-containing protein (putative c-di-GMP-specific phosphodiesterase class I)